jgi:hypothetical protein
MRLRKYIWVITMSLLALGISCRDESLYPLPYDDREVGAYMRLYSITSNVIDINDLPNSGLDAVFEAVDDNGGNNLQEFRIFVRHRRGTTLTPEVLVKTIPASDFTDVAEPTFSEYKRARVRVTANETIAALATIPAAPGPAFPGSLSDADQVVYRGVMVLKDGREFTDGNTTPNITGGQFYSASFVYTLTARAITAGTWTGAFTLTQNSIWSPNHAALLHTRPEFPSYMNQVLFPTQTVTLAKPATGLSTEREFSVNYRGQTVTFRFNLEPTPTQDAPTSGTIFVPLQNSTVDCSSERELYWTFPPGGNFTVAGLPAGAVMPPGTPQATVANRGSYNTTQGATPGNALTIGIDDDADEYGRRNGYCTWTRRVRLTLTKL